MMNDLQVWAPNARTVDVIHGSRRDPMASRPGGWWCLEGLSVEHGKDYAFCIDGEGILPDPRSAWQPEGVEGGSRRVDPERFDWTDAGWQPPPLAAGVIYELHIGTFTPQGTFAAAIDRLDALVDLGITHVELMPVAAFSGQHGWGYDGVDLYAPHPAYGEPDDLRRLVDACHHRGLAVLLDVVYNHLGPHGNFLPRFGPYFTDRYSTPWGEAVNLDGAGSDEVRRFFIDNACMWLRDYHFDGLRLDAVHAIVDISAVHFLEQLATEVQHLEATLGRHLVVIAESDLNTPRLVQSPDAGGYGLDAHWADDFHHALHTTLTGENAGYYADFRGLQDLAVSLRRGYVYEGQCAPSRERCHGRPARITHGGRLVVCMQNHDQIGNRAVGERIHHLAGLRRTRVGAALLLTSPFVPLLFQGEEWAASSPFQYFTAHTDPDLGQAVREGRQHEFTAFGWQPDDVPDPQDRATLERSRLRWNERTQNEHAQMLAWYKALIRLRRTEPDLRNADMAAVSVDGCPEHKTLSMRRGAILTVCSLDTQARRLALPAGTTARSLLLASDPDVRMEGGELLLPPESVAIVRIARNADGGI